MLLERPSPIFDETCRVVLETERLELRRPTLADVKAIARLANDRRVAQNTARIPFPYSQTDAERFVHSVAAQPRDTTFLITRLGDPLGVAAIDIGRGGCPELGYWLGVPYWGQGYATEAARAMIDYAFEAFGHGELRAGARVVNPASRRVLEKCGFQWTGVELRKIVSLGSSTPVDRFRLDRGVWSSLKSWRDAYRRRSCSGAEQRA
ncbi:N-acetyltransferase GCN5 [Afipia sp. P52-10]|jgi:RimJ/RimL family protein N-acetyltransferase|uniref:GNAT family N-acetyltransferase n=1 Tax=Afipia sp. P52-10 TaxID=1429916 RepID=UPI0003DF279F|nr:GNAT family N-acetyltransferase [Afipia sp. P52-10]ETR77591.1 N-acetyltransferase GCN5 [Afipia sp. P52-10]